MDIGEVDLCLQVLAGGQMDVRVVEPRKHGLAVEVDDAGVRSPGLAHRGIAADRDKAAALDCGRARGREARVDGDDMRIVNDEVGRLCDGERLGRGKGGDGQHEGTHHDCCPRLESEAGA